MLDVCLLGTAGMMPLPNRWLTSLMTRYNGKNLLIDCGEGTQIALRETGWSPKPVEVICFTHYHADHISGLPGFLLTLGNAQRTEPVTMIGPRGLERVVKALCTIAPELPFEIHYRELTREREHISIAGYEIDAYRVAHNVACYGYALQIPRAGKFDAARARELGLPVQTWSLLQKGEEVLYEGKVYTSDMVMGAARKGIKLAYCTDSRPVDAIVEGARDADLFICEGMYADPEKLEKAKQYKHMTFYEAAELAERACVKELWLTHFSPSLVQPGRYMENVRAIFDNAHLGKDGKMLTLDFQEDSE